MSTPKRDGRTGGPVVITDAGDSPKQEYNRRRRKYSLMMGGRVACVIAAACTYSVSLWLALGFIVGGAVLPWCAVLIANDRQPKRAQRPMRRFVAPSTDRALTSGTTSGMTSEQGGSSAPWGETRKVIDL